MDSVIPALCALNTALNALLYRRNRRLYEVTGDWKDRASYRLNAIAAVCWSLVPMLRWVA